MLITIALYSKRGLRFLAPLPPYCGEGQGSASIDSGSMSLFRLDFVMFFGKETWGTYSYSQMSFFHMMRRNIIQSDLRTSSLKPTKPFLRDARWKDRVDPGQALAGPRPSQARPGGSSRFGGKSLDNAIPSSRNGELSHACLSLVPP